MKLFNKLAGTPSIDPSSFSGVLLKRLSIMEAIATTKFPDLSSVSVPDREKIVIDNTRMKCHQRGYSDTKIDSIIQIFTAGMTLAKLIQIACINEWEQSSVESVRALGLIFAQKIISEQIKEETLLLALRDYLTGITDDILNALDSAKPLDSLNDLVDLVIECFPLIDKQALTEAILIINREMKPEYFGPDTPLSEPSLLNNNVHHRRLTDKNYIVPEVPYSISLFEAPLKEDTHYNPSFATLFKKTPVSLSPASKAVSEYASNP